MDPPESNPSNLRQAVSSDLGLHDTHLVDAPLAHVLDIKSMIGPTRLMDPIQGTWKRLGPSKNKTMDQEAILPCVGPKRKPEEMCKLDDITLEKKQKLAEEDSTMARTITDNMESGPMSVLSWNCRGLGNPDRKSTRLNSSHRIASRMPSSA